MQFTPNFMSQRFPTKNNPPKAMSPIAINTKAGVDITASLVRDMNPKKVGRTPVAPAISIDIPPTIIPIPAQRKPIRTPNTPRIGPLPNIKRRTRRIIVNSLSEELDEALLEFPVLLF